jgi:hypothetical protein
MLAFTCHPAREVDVPDGAQLMQRVKELVVQEMGITVQSDAALWIASKPMVNRGAAAAIGAREGDECCFSRFSREWLCGCGTAEFPVGWKHLAELAAAAAAEDGPAAGPACSTTGADARVVVAPLCSACSACAGDDGDGVHEASRDSIDCMEGTIAAGCARGASEDSESSAGEGEEETALSQTQRGVALTHVTIGQVSAAASLPVASVRLDAWLLMQDSAVG